MKTATEGIERRLAELREAFDASFTMPASPGDVDQEDMLAIRVGGGRFAVRVSELAGVHACRKIVPLPGEVLGLLGVVGIRGRLVAAYRLTDLVSAGPPEGPMRWLLACAADSQVGLLIESLDAYLRITAANLHPARNEEGISEHVREVLQHDSGSRGVLSVPSILASIARRAHAVPSPKES